MQLTSLEIFGFKSFAERTKFVFDNGITGIVGPNGCGKSNIVDSIRWVLGEQKTRNLRSDKMENVIFNGTQSRRKSNFAEVSLTFENTKNILPTEYSTVTITRKLYRSGESEYLINGVNCRLKDIHNLFMDTGIGSDSYAIIELKMVDGILTNKDNERRKFFEEAAGISKYKVRKKQTMKRLQDTDADLERVEDLLFEIEKNLKSLERQASRTQKYFELKAQYKLFSSQYAFLMVKNIRERQNQIKVLGGNLEDELVRIQTEMAQRDARLLDLKKQLLDQEKIVAFAQSQLNEHIRAIQAVETDKSIKGERLKYLQQRELSIQQQSDNEKRQMLQGDQEIEDLSRKEKEVQYAFDEQKSLDKQLLDELETIRHLHEEQQAQANEAIANQRLKEKEIADLQRERQVAEVRIKSLNEELKRAEEDQQHRAEDLDAFGERAHTLEVEVNQLEEHVKELQLAKDQHESSLKQLDEEINELKDKVYKTNRKLDARQNEFSLTKSLVENLEGFPESVKFLKKNAKWIKNAPLLSDIFVVPEAFKVAFENYLDPYLSYYVVKSREDAVLSVHLLADSSKGRANFFILEELDNFQPANPLLFTQAQAAMELIEVHDEYRKLASYLLSNVYVVDHESLIPEEIPLNTVFLTRSGNLSRKRFSLSGGSLGLFEGKRLGRAKNMEKLEGDIGKLQKQLTAEKVLLEEKVSKIQNLKKQDHNTPLDTAKQSLVERQRDLSILQSREKEHKEFLERVGNRSESLKEELEKLSLSFDELEPQTIHSQKELESISIQANDARKMVEVSTQQMNSLSQRYNQEHISLIHLQNELNNLIKERENKISNKEKLNTNQSRLKEDLAQVKSDIEQLINSNLQDDEAIVGMYEEKKKKESATDEAEQKLAMIKNSIIQSENILSESRKNREKVLEQQHQMKDTESEIKIEYSSLRERMSVEFQIELNDLEQDQLFEKEPKLSLVEELEPKVKRIRERIQGFGEINPMAVEAFNEMKERFDFISGQRLDLIDAKNSLLETISEIDEQAKEKFLETFTVVRDHFHKVFRSLFSEDDTCDLILLDADNPLESEISIIARPKGKRPLTISQLSGGEKTLTAVALLFSIYLIKPAPFCIFDEVDAPLDDANIDKFNNIIRDFSANSQFIIVTHNKRTMAATNIMYGVTMENQGVSRVLPVNLEGLSLN